MQTRATSDDLRIVRIDIVRTANGQYRIESSYVMQDSAGQPQGGGRLDLHFPTADREMSAVEALIRRFPGGTGRVEISWQPEDRYVVEGLHRDVGPSGRSRGGGRHGADIDRNDRDYPALTQLIQRLVTAVRAAGGA